MKKINLSNAILCRIEKEINLFYALKISYEHNIEKDAFNYYVNQSFLLNYAEKFFKEKNVLEDILTQISLYRNIYFENLKQIVLNDLKIPVDLIICHGFIWAKTSQGIDFWLELDKEFQSFIYNIKRKAYYLTDIIK